MSDGFQVDLGALAEAAGGVNGAISDLHVPIQAQGVDPATRWSSSVTGATNWRSTNRRVRSSGSARTTLSMHDGPSGQRRTPHDHDLR